MDVLERINWLYSKVAARKDTVRKSRSFSGWVGRRRATVSWVGGKLLLSACHLHSSGRQNVHVTWPVIGLPYDRLCLLSPRETLCVFLMPNDITWSENINHPSRTLACFSLTMGTKMRGYDKENVSKFIFNLERVQTHFSTSWLLWWPEVHAGALCVRRFLMTAALHLFFVPVCWKGTPSRGNVYNWGTTWWLGKKRCLPNGVEELLPQVDPSAS